MAVGSLLLAVAGAAAAATAAFPSTIGAAAPSAGAVPGGRGSGGGHGITAAAAPPGVCGSGQMRRGPASPPPGAVTVPTGDDDAGQLGTPHTTYWFAPGVHTLGGGKYAQVEAGDGDTYVGAPGAVLSGRGVNLFAFTGHAMGVTITYLTVEHFGRGGDNGTQGVVNHTSGSSWTVELDTIEHNAGAGVMLGSADILRDNCLFANTQYGFSAYRTGGAVTSVTVTGNDVSGNATFNWDASRPGCGCFGGAKFWDTRGAVVTGNFVHGNHGPGLWVDTDDAGFDISHNYVARNYAEGIVYEVSYNALIAHNTLVDNGWHAGAKPTAGFPEPAIYVSESGADARVPGPFSGTFEITGNILIDNWGGVILWENANRSCGDGYEGSCTLVDPTVFTSASCKAALPHAAPGGRPDYFDNCRWKTTGVRVSGNTFVFTPKAIGPECTVKRECGYSGLFSEYGTVPPFKGWVVPHDISDEQHDVFTVNSYRGPWRFDGFALGVRMTWTQWTHGVHDVAGSGYSFDPQDGGSTYHP
ncbi:MAG: right-handed parallel beta-helix repeat-containing protein [Acidimicrobiales bacterium]